MNIFSKIIHFHKFERVPRSMRACGTTLGWDFLPTTEYEFLKRCSCGAEEWEGGFVLPRKLEEFKVKNSL